MSNHCLSGSFILILSVFQMPQGFGGSSFPPRVGVRGPGDGDRVLPREDRGGHVQAAPVAVPQLRDHHRAGAGRLPARLRPDGRHQH